MSFNIDVYKLGRMLLPPVLRRTRIFAFLKTMLTAVKDIVDNFDEFKQQADAMLSVNGTVASLEKLLNDRYYLPDRDIYITDGDGLQVPYLYADQNNTIPVYQSASLDQTYVYGQNEGSASADFIVHIPSIVEYDIENIKSLLEFFKPAGRSFEIKIYEYNE